VNFNHGTWLFSASVSSAIPKRKRESPYCREYPSNQSSPAAEFAMLTTDVQNAHRFAATGISLKHSGHFLLVGSAGVALRADRAFHAFIGATIKK
jgi:hypothetical protein